MRIIEILTEMEQMLRGAGNAGFPITFDAHKNVERAEALAAAQRAMQETPITRSAGGGPMFPNDFHPEGGLRKRDWFAGMALQGILSAQGAAFAAGGVITNDSIDGHYATTADLAYRMADAMLTVRNNKEE